MQPEVNLEPQKTVDGTADLSQQRAIYVAIILVLIPLALVQNPPSLPVSKQRQTTNPEVLSGYTHLLWQERSLNLEDLVQ